MGEHRRDRKGESFQDNMTENEGATPAAREQASHHLRPDGDINSQESDEMNRDFADRLKKSGHSSGH